MRDLAILAVDSGVRRHGAVEEAMMRRNSFVWGRPSISRGGALLICALAATAGEGCGRGRPLTGQRTSGGEVVVFSTSPQRIVAPGSADPVAFRAALARTLEREHWTVASDDGARIVARREHRQLVLQLALTIEGAEGLEVSYVDSTNMPIETPTSSRRYDAWVRELQNALLDEVDRPRRDAEEAGRHAEELARQERERQEREARELAERQAQAQRTAGTGSSTTAQATLHLPRLTFDGAAASTAPQAIVLRPGWTDTAYDGSAGGNVAGASMGLPPNCTGFFQALPQHTIVLPADAGRLTLTVQAPRQTTLLVVGPGGQAYCEPSGTFSRGLSHGAYRVYVGNAGAPDVVAYRLAVSQQAIDGVQIQVSGIEVTQDLTHTMGQ